MPNCPPPLPNPPPHPLAKLTMTCDFICSSTMAHHASSTHFLARFSFYISSQISICSRLHWNPNVFHWTNINLSNLDNHPFQTLNSYWKDFIQHPNISKCVIVVVDDFNVANVANQDVVKACRHPQTILSRTAGWNTNCVTVQGQVLAQTKLRVTPAASPLPLVPAKGGLLARQEQLPRHYCWAPPWGHPPCNFSSTLNLPTASSHSQSYIFTTFQHIWSYFQFPLLQVCFASVFLRHLEERIPCSRYTKQ